MLSSVDMPEEMALEYYNNTLKDVYKSHDNFFVIILINLILGSIEPISVIYYNSSRLINSENDIDTDKFNIYNNLFVFLI